MQLFTTHIHIKKNLYLKWLKNYSYYMYFNFSKIVGLVYHWRFIIPSISSLAVHRCHCIPTSRSLRVHDCRFMIVGSWLSVNDCWLMTASAPMQVVHNFYLIIFSSFFCLIVCVIVVKVCFAYDYWKGLFKKREIL